MPSVTSYAIWPEMSQDIFQMLQMDQITDRLPGIIAIHDDIYVYGRDSTEHDRNLLQLMQIASSEGCVLKKVSVTFSSPKFPFMVQSLQCKARNQILQR